MEDLAILAGKHNVSNIVLFGSMARGDNNAKSDIDIAVYGCDILSNFPWMWNKIYGLY